MRFENANYLAGKKVTRRLHTTLLRSLFVLMLVVVSGTGGATAADPIVVPAILSMTGTFSFYGQGQAATLHAVETLVNKRGGIAGRPLLFQVQDDQGLPQVAVEMVNAFIGAKAPIVIGPATSVACAAVLPLLKDGPVSYCMSNGVHPTPGSFMFTSSMWTTAMIDVDLRYFRLRGVKRIALITSTDTGGQDGERAIDTALNVPENRPMAIVAREHFNDTDISVLAQMSHFRAVNPDLIILWSAGTPVGTLFRGQIQAGLGNVPTLTSSGNLTYAQMKQYTDSLPRDLYFAGMPEFAPGQIADKRVRDAVVLFRETLETAGIKPDYVAVSMWDPAMLIVEALRKLGPTATAEQVRAFLANLKGWVGAGGMYDFPTSPQRGLGEENVMVLRWEASKQTWSGVSKPGGVPL